MEGYRFDMHAAATSHIMHHDVISNTEVMLKDLANGLETVSFILCTMLGGRAESAPAILPKSCHARSLPEAARIGVAASCSILPSKRPRVALPE